MQYSVKVESPKKNVRKLIITVSAETVQNEIQRQFQAVQGKAKIKGFRPGKVPLEMVRKIYGKEVNSEAMSQLIENSYWKAIEEQKLRTVSRPKIGADNSHGHPHLHENEELTYTATVEIFPEFDLKDYKGISLKREKVDVSEKDVDGVLERLRESRGELIPLLEDRPIKKGDFVDMEFKGLVQADSGSYEPRDKMSGHHVVEVGSNSLIPGFEDQLLGLKKNDQKTFDIDFPADYGEKEIAGRKARFEVKIQEIKKKQLPEMNDEFAKDFQAESVKDLREKSKKNLEDYKREEDERKLRGDLVEELIKRNEFDVPEAMVMAQIRILMDQTVQNLRNQGIKDEEAQKALETEYPRFKEKAERQVRSALILDRISQKEDIQVTEQDFEKEYDRLAGQIRESKDQIRDYYSKNPREKENLEFRLKEDLTIQFLLGQAKIK